MGDDISSRTFTREERLEHRHKVRRCLDVFAEMLSHHQFEDSASLTGLEIELNLVTPTGDPAMKNAQVLDAIADPAFQTELAKYNIELNVPPAPLPGKAVFTLEKDLRTALNRADERARSVGGAIAMIGILPTLRPEHLSGEWMSANPRYQALEEAIFAARGEDIELDISGPEPLQMHTSTIAPESACTSVQLHLQVSPSDFAPAWNAAQLLAGPQLALGANSPYLFGHRLWAETRTELFLQATDTRSPELRNQGVRPPVFFGDNWITSIFDLFEENVRYFPALLPESTPENPEEELAAGRTPRLQELRLHNGTVYRWNRPIYDVVDGRPHLRVENRVLPAGPTVADTLANAAFYYGALEMLASDERPMWTRMTFSAAQENFTAGARDGVEARMYWPGFGHLSWDELILRHLLPLAAEGLARRRLDSEVIDHYLGIIEARAKRRVNGASWQVATVEALEGRGRDRNTALHQMLELYLERMHSNDPVHTWDVPR